MKNDSFELRISIIFFVEKVRFIVIKDYPKKKEVTHMTILQRPLLSFLCPSGQYVGTVIIFLDPICGLNLSGITILSWILFSFFFSPASISPFSISGIFSSFVVDVIFVTPLIDLRSCKIICINDVIIALTTFGCAFAIINVFWLYCIFGSNTSLLCIIE